MDATSIVYLSGEVVVGFITVVGNCFVLAVIIRTRQLHTVTNVFVGNLAIADIAVGVLVAPCAALSYLGLPHNFYACVFINCLILMFTNVSILMLLAVAIERFIAIKEPFVYQRLLTVKRAICVNFLVWILGTILGLVPLYGWHRGYRILDRCSFTDIISYEYLVYFQFFGLVLLPLFVMLCIYIYILLIVRKHMRQTNALHNQFRQSKDAKDTTFKKDVKAAKMFALVILLFGIFWLPVNLFNTVSLFCGMDCPFPIQGLLAAIVMSHANSSINPFLYATSNSRIKRGLKELLRIKLKPEERSTTDYDNKRTNGFSYAKDNSVAPISSVDDSPHHIQDAVQVFTVSQTFLAKGKISVLPLDQDQQHKNGVVNKTVRLACSETDIQQNVNIHKSPDHASNSTPLVKAEPLLVRPASQGSHREKQLQIETTMNKPSVTQSTTPASYDSQSHDFENNHIPHNHECINAHTNRDYDEAKHEDSVPVADARSNQVSPSQNHSVTDIRKSENVDSNHGNNLCWTTTINSEAENGFVHCIDKSDIFNEQAVVNKRHSVSMNDSQKTNSTGEFGEELTENKLNDYVPSERTVDSNEDINRQSPLDKRHNKEIIGEDLIANTHISNSIESVSQDLKNDASFKSSILLEECEALRESETEHTKF